MAKFFARLSADEFWPIAVILQVFGIYLVNFLLRREKSSGFLVQFGHRSGAERLIHRLVDRFGVVKSPQLFDVLWSTFHFKVTFPGADSDSLWVSGQLSNTYHFLRLQRCY
jgi:hypothetical protein